MDIQIVQLTSLRPTADTFCAHLRDALKSELQKGHMKAVKPFVKTCFSEWLLSEGGELNENGEAVKVKSDKDDGEGKGEAEKDGVEGDEKEDVPYLGGLGLTFKFPGDAKK